MTCRGWNWRRCVRTRRTEDTVNVVCILDVLDPVSSDALWAAGHDLVDRLRAHAPDAVV